MKFMIEAGNNVLYFSLLFFSSTRCRQISSSQSIDSESSMTSTDFTSGDQKYRRMRDLNNIASQRCRQNRKRKLEILQSEEEKETERNNDLKIKVRLLEEQVKRVKDAIFKSIVPAAALNPFAPVANPFNLVSTQFVDIDKIVEQRAADLL